MRVGIRSGWGGFDQLKTMSSKFPDRAWPTEEAQLYFFLDGEPFVTFRHHWVAAERGNRPYVCIEDDCPLCDVGDEPTPVICFNVVHMNVGGQPLVKAFQINVTQTEALKKAASQPGVDGIDDPNIYWSVYTSGKAGKKGQGQKTTTFTRVKRRDLEEEWSITPLTDDELDKLWDKRYTADSVDYPTRKELRRIAAELNEEDED